jgi:AsmA-like C-terminal region/AsmA family
VKLLSSKRRRIVAGALILLLLFLLRPGASRLKSRIITSMSYAVGRSVDIGSVHLRLLPRPGFDLQNLVVYDDSAFGAEPMLRASEVTAALRLTSLVRGKIEIARLDLTEPSLNLVHGENGRWNLEALLERAAHTPLAPTAKAKLEPRAGFPYIEATSARINFKNGQEKKPFALTNADFSLWQDSENTWGVRLVAQPVRTDLSLNDTGLLRVSGTWQRAPTLRETPINFSLEWNRAQLGQLTKLFTRNDQGWRGGVDIASTMVGTPAKLVVRSDVTVQDFRRYDIASGEPLRLAAHCDGQYSSLDHMFHGVMCNAPVGNGLIALKGDVGLLGSHRYGLVLIANDVPAAAVVALAQRTKKNLPEDLTAAGVVNANVVIDESTASQLRLEGQGEIADFHLVSAANKAEIGPIAIPFVFTRGDIHSTHAQTHQKSTVMRLPEYRIALGPFAVGRTNTPTLYGWVNRSGYSFAFAGETEISKALRITRMLGLPVTNAAAEGLAQLDLHIAGAWQGWGHETHANFSGPQIMGSAKLRNVRVSVRGAEEPVVITSAELQLGPDNARVEKLNANVAGTVWSGSLEMPRRCGTPGACEVHFNLKADRIALDELHAWASPHPKDQPWYRVLETSVQAPPPVMSLRASGHVTADRLQMHALTATHISANISLDRGKLQVSELKADLLGGIHAGSWQADFSVKPTICRGVGSLSGLQLAHLSDPTAEPVDSGIVSGTYQMSGSCGAAGTSFWTSFWKSAEGTFQFNIQDGTLPRFSLETAGPLQFTRLSGQARLHDGKFEVKDAKLDSTSGKSLLSGTASLQRELELKLTRNATNSAGGYTITGTLTEPRITPLPGAEQARLKQDAAK